MPLGTILIIVLVLYLLGVFGSGRGWYGPQPVARSPGPYWAGGPYVDWVAVLVVVIIALILFGVIRI
jgi:hypothetical protein